MMVKFYSDNNFRSGYLEVLETALDTKLPGCGIKAKPHIESWIKTLKMQFQTVHEMLTGSNFRLVTVLMTYVRSIIVLMHSF